MDSRWFALVSTLRVIIGDRGEGFANEKKGLGASTGPRAWTLVEFPPTEAERVAVLATDGVADDLAPERINGFCDWLIGSFGPLAPHQRHSRLAAELRAWPTLQRAAGVTMPTDRQIGSYPIV